MGLRRPTEDFLRGSVHPLMGKFARLFYCAELRDSGKEYQHWGMERTYGEDTAKKSMAEVHSLVWLEVLQSPIQDLETDSRAALREKSGIREISFDIRMIPEDDRGAIPRHFRFVLQTVNQLLRH